MFHPHLILPTRALVARYWNRLSLIYRHVAVFDMVELKFPAFVIKPKPLCDRFHFGFGTESPKFTILSSHSL